MTLLDYSAEIARRCNKIQSGNWLMVAIQDGKLISDEVLSSAERFDGPGITEQGSFHAGTSHNQIQFQLCMREAF